MKTQEQAPTLTDGQWRMIAPRASEPRVSPDGKQLAYLATAADELQIVSLRLPERQRSIAKKGIDPASWRSLEIDRTIRSPTAIDRTSPTTSAVTSCSTRRSFPKCPAGERLRTAGPWFA